MNNNQFQPPNQPQQNIAYQLTAEQVAQIRKSNKQKLIWALVLMIGPTLLFILNLIIGLIFSFSFRSTLESSIGVSVFNIITYLIGIVATLAWFPGLITGIILLVTRKNI